MVVSYDLLRAARVLLDISAKALAEKAGVSKRTLVRIEACEPVGLKFALRVQTALEAEGIEFVQETEKNGPGVFVRKGLVRKVGFQIDG